MITNEVFHLSILFLMDTRLFIVNNYVWWAGWRKELLMLSNIIKNRFWFLKALETYSLAIYFIVKRSTGIFDWDHSPLAVLDDPPFIFMLAVVGTIALVFALWDIKHLYYKQIMTGTLTFVWLAFFLSFCTNDALREVYLSFPGIYAFFVLVGIVRELRWE